LGELGAYPSYVFDASVKFGVALVRVLVSSRS
jgi:hypothetical protein